MQGLESSSAFHHPTTHTVESFLYETGPAFKHGLIGPTQKKEKLASNIISPAVKANTKAFTTSSSPKFFHFSQVPNQESVPNDNLQSILSSKTSYFHYYHHVSSRLALPSARNDE